MTLALLPSITPTHEFVVPRSMPITLLMGTSCQKQDRSARESTVPIPRETRQPWPGGRAGYICDGMGAYQPAPNRSSALRRTAVERVSVIVSASYRTDIPAFYAGWFLRRLAAGYCRVANPYGGGAYQVRLTPDAVDGFVLWTRNLRPLLPDLNAVRRVAPFIVQFTLTGYPRPLETSVIAVEEALGQLRELRHRFGPRVAVWRYDPIVFTAELDAAAHEAGFAALARALNGTVDEVVLSVMHPYRKTRRNLDRAASRHGFAWYEPAPEEKRQLLGRLAAIAREEGMAATLCSQPELLAPGLGDATCIDAE